MLKQLLFELNFIIFVILVKSAFIKITSFVLAFLVLFSTFSFTIEKHFCGDYLVDISYFGNAEDCSVEIGDDCESPTSIKKKKCCKDEIQQIEGQDDLKNSVEKFDLEKQQFLTAFAVSYYNLFQNIKEQKIPHKHYSPPKLIFDIQVLFEVFII